MLVYRGRSLIRGVRTDVECRSDQGGYSLRVGPLLFDVLPTGDVRACPRQGDFTESETRAFASPAAVLSLGLRGLYCLHASAVETPRGALAFVGRSGKGKSTLAAHLSAGPSSKWPLVSDDILPVDLVSSPPAAFRGMLPDSPLGDGRRLPLRAVYVLCSTRRDEVTVSPLSRTEGFVTLARHTAASRLFEPSLKARHFEACVAGSLVLPVRVLRYPRRFAILEAVRRSLERDVESLAGER